MAIRFIDKPDDRSRKPTKASGRPRGATGEEDGPAPEPSPAPSEAATLSSASDARAEGEARFATPIEAVAPVNSDASDELPFGDLPRAEKAARKKRTPKTAKPTGSGAA